MYLEILNSGTKISCSSCSSPGLWEISKAGCLIEYFLVTEIFEQLTLTIGWVGRRGQFTVIESGDSYAHIHI